MLGEVWSLFFFFKHKTAYEMRISDWSSDVCSSDLPEVSVEEGHDPRLGIRSRRFVEAHARQGHHHGHGEGQVAAVVVVQERVTGGGVLLHVVVHPELLHGGLQPICQTGRASCRESVCQYV